MANLWVVRPGQSYDMTKFEALGAELQGEIARIEALGDATACRLCGNVAPLTDEHTPSKRAGNVGKFVRGVIDDAATDATGTVTWRAERVQGITHASLCGDCNNKTGSWYNPSYVRITRGVRRDAHPRNAGGEVAVDFTGVARQRVAKQALTTIVATAQPGFTAAYPDIRALLLDRDRANAITPLQLSLFLLANNGGATTGFTTGINLEEGAGWIVAGFAFWPLGWLLTLRGAAPSGTVDVSDWLTLHPDDKAPATVTVPCQRVLGAYPGDFRSPEQLRGDASRPTA